jgi:hypothetical protein
MRGSGKALQKGRLQGTEGGEEAPLEVALFQLSTVSIKGPKRPASLSALRREKGYLWNKTR